MIFNNLFGDKLLDSNECPTSFQEPAIKTIKTISLGDSSIFNTMVLIYHVHTHTYRSGVLGG